MTELCPDRYYFAKNGSVYHSHDQYGDRCGGLMGARYDSGRHYYRCHQCGHEVIRCVLEKRKESAS